ncbi:MAG: acetyl-CoA C-acetyltransferase [Bryobacterales bacterium]|jgi:acetyl-CoA C-acetyltransferase|nr:acetyl-CoA C-acetyltransferase [Bryobacterales bacterium]
MGYEVDVAIVGAGKTPFGAFPAEGLRALAVEAGEKALADAQCAPDAIQAFYLGNFAGPEFTGQNHLAPYISTALGMDGIPSTRFEAACASSGAAFFHAFMAVSSGIYDCVMVLGVEKMTSQSTARVTEILCGAGDWAEEMRAGSTFPSLFAMIARRHMHDFGTTREHLAAVAVKNHENGALNPDAQMRKVITLEQAMNSKPIAEPLNLYDCSLISDGAAAVIISAGDRARRYTDKPVSVLGIAQASDHVALDQKADITTFPAVQRAARKAYAMAGLGPQEIDFAELHDCFTIAELVAMEDLGFVGRGRAGFFTADGGSRRNGALPINASGGLKSKGHPVGATGIAQICDVVQQLRGEAGERQLKRHSIGLAQNLGGSGGTCVVTILGQE